MENQIKISLKKKVDFNTILACKADANYTQIYFEDGTKYLSACTLALFDVRLKAYPFFRANRSILINLNAIQQTNFETIHLKNKMEIIVSRNRMAEFKTIIDSKNFNN